MWRRTALVLVAALWLGGTSDAATAPHCSAGRSPTMLSSLVPLTRTLGDVMGGPVECPHVEPSNGDTLQRTTGGLAYVRGRTGLPTFTDGWRHWAWVADDVVAWQGARADPPASLGSDRAVAAEASRLASHLLLATGQVRSIRGLGRLLEVIQLSEPPAVRVDGMQLTGLTGGASCLRFAYRDVDAENGVQTQCVVVIDEVGACAGLPNVELDLQTFLTPAGSADGNANLLESGRGAFYAICRTPAGAYRLQRPARPVPPLYFTVVDALGDGAYSLGTPELDRQRAGAVTTFDGDVLEPPWIVSVSGEIEDLRLNDDLQVEFTAAACAVSPACTTDADTVRAGDIVRVSAGVSGGQFQTLFNATSLERRDRFFRDRIGLPWTAIARVHPDAQQLAFTRLVALDLMAGLVHDFDRAYGLRAKGVTVGYWAPHPAQTPLPYPFACFPDTIVPGETARCTAIEQAIQAAEARSIGALRAAGFDLWQAVSLEYGEGGAYAPLLDARPLFNLFDGVVAGIGASSAVQVNDIPATLAGVVQAFAAEIGSGRPVVLSLNGPPITAQTGGGFCEAAICPADFAGMFSQAEATLRAATDVFTAQQLLGFGVALFDGAHFDIRQPHEDYGGFSLNRAGETGYNNPVLNIYRAA